MTEMFALTSSQEVAAFVSNSGVLVAGWDSQAGERNLAIKRARYEDVSLGASFEISTYTW